MINITDIVFTTECAVKVGKKCYFVASEMNVICSIDILTEKIEIIGSIPEEDVFSERLCTKIVVWHDELIFVPMNAEKIWFFHLVKKEWSSLCIRDANIQRKIRQAFIYKNKLFMVGCHYPAIICVDLKTEAIQYIDAPFREVQGIYEKKNIYGYFRHDCVLRNHWLYIASFVTNKVLVFNLEDLHWEYVTVGNAENGYSGITWDGECFWLAPNDKAYIVKWDGKKQCIEYPLPCYENKKILFLGVVFVNGDVIFPAARIENTLVLHSADIEKYEMKREQYLFYTVCNDREIISGDVNGNIIIYSDNKQRHCIRCSISVRELLDKLNISNEKYEEYIYDKFLNMARESCSLGLKTLLSHIVDQKENEKLIEQKESMSYGETIWKTLS